MKKFLKKSVPIFDEIANAAFYPPPGQQDSLHYTIPSLAHQL
jgi:hypothetical protein